MQPGVFCKGKGMFEFLEVFQHIAFFQDLLVARQYTLQQPGQEIPGGVHARVVRPWVPVTPVTPVRDYRLLPHKSSCSHPR